MPDISPPRCDMHDVIHRDSTAPPETGRNILAFLGAGCAGVSRALFNLAAALALLMVLG
ncbi:MAG: hypothetical protein JJU42_07140 [Rhodobacteraceae bacterium]|nr:hypothetical protein [Paracoccaceae bacterium]